MKKFRCTYREMMEEPYEVLETNMMILSLEAEEQNNRDKLEKMKSRLK